MSSLPITYDYYPRASRLRFEPGPAAPKSSTLSTRLPSHPNHPTHQKLKNLDPTRPNPWTAVVWRCQVVGDAGGASRGAAAARRRPAGGPAGRVRGGRVARPRQAGLAGSLARHTTSRLQPALLRLRRASPPRHVRAASLSLSLSLSF